MRSTADRLLATRRRTLDTVRRTIDAVQRVIEHNETLLTMPGHEDRAELRIAEGHVELAELRRREVELLELLAGEESVEGSGT